MMSQSCKPSPARSAAAVILATLLGGQPQEQGQEHDQEREQQQAERADNSEHVDGCEATASVAAIGLVHPTGSESKSSSNNASKSTEETTTRKSQGLGGCPWLPRQPEQTAAAGAFERPQSAEKAKVGSAGLGQGGRVPRMPGRPQRLQWGQEEAGRDAPEWALLCTVVDENRATTQHDPAVRLKATATTTATASPIKPRVEGESAAIRTPGSLAPRSPSTAVRRSPRKRSPCIPSDANHDAHHSDSQSQGRGQEQGQSQVLSFGGVEVGDDHEDGVRALTRKSSVGQPAAGTWTPSSKDVPSSMSGRLSSKSKGGRKVHLGSNNQQGNDRQGVTPAPLGGGADGSSGEGGGGDGGGLLFSQEGLGMEMGLGNELGYSNYCRKDKVG